MHSDTVLSAVVSLPDESQLTRNVAAVQEVPLGWLRELPVHLHPDSPSLHGSAVDIPQKQRKIRYAPCLLHVWGLTDVACKIQGAMYGNQNLLSTH